NNLSGLQSIQLRSLRRAKSAGDTSRKGVMRRDLPERAEISGNIIETVIAIGGARISAGNFHAVAQTRIAIRIRGATDHLIIILIKLVLAAQSGIQVQRLTGLPARAGKHGSVVSRHSVIVVPALRQAGDSKVWLRLKLLQISVNPFAIPARHRRPAGIPLPIMDALPTRTGRSVFLQR